MRRPFLLLCLIAVLTISACGTSTDLPQPGIRWADCDLPGIEETARCGTFEVPEDRANPERRRIGLHVVVLPATGPEPAPDALTFLAGGGVVPATNYTAFLGRALSRVRETRDIVLVDQRGTGRSNPLHCDLPDEVGDERRAALEACLDALEGHADPRFYTTPYAMDDLDELRDALGYEQLTLWGVSYGTKAARVYVRRHPGKARAVVLHGTIPIASSLWFDLPASEAAFLDRVLDRCAVDPACSAAYPGIREDYAEAIDRLESDPVTIEATGEVLDADTFRRRLYGSLRSMRMAAGIPGVIRRVADGNLVDFEGGKPEGPPPVPRGVYLSIACSEEFGRLDPAEIESARATMPSAGRDWFDRERADCETWPAAGMPEDYWSPLRSDVPTLFLVGEEDYITPPRYSEAAARTLSNATVVPLPGRSHDDFDPCLGEILQDFVIGGDADGLDTSCLARDPFPPFAVE